MNPPAICPIGPVCGEQDSRKSSAGTSSATRAPISDEQSDELPHAEHDQAEHRDHQDDRDHYEQGHDEPRH